jgi:hypothetical protein
MTIEAARTRDGDEPAESFIAKLFKSRRKIREVADLVALFEEWARLGRLDIPMQQRELDGDLWEVKTAAVRLPYYEFTDMHGRTARLTHGFEKDTGRTAEGRTPRKHIVRGLWIMREDREC